MPFPHSVSALPSRSTMVANALPSWWRLAWCALYPQAEALGRKRRLAQFSWPDGRRDPTVGGPVKVVGGYCCATARPWRPAQSRGGKSAAKGAPRPSARQESPGDTRSASAQAGLARSWPRRAERLRHAARISRPPSSACAQVSGQALERPRWAAPCCARLAGRWIKPTRRPGMAACLGERMIKRGIAQIAARVAGSEGSGYPAGAGAPTM